MEIKKPNFDPADAARILAKADKQIGHLKKTLLPEIPHLLVFKQEENQPLRFFNPYEHRGMPFESHELKVVPYMTLDSFGDRGTLHPIGDWQDRIEARRLGGSVTSAASTPRPETPSDVKLPKKKIAFSEYQRAKKEGTVPVATPVSADGGHSRNTSQVSEPMSRGSSSEGVGEAVTRPYGGGVDRTKAFDGNDKKSFEIPSAPAARPPVAAHSRPAAATAQNATRNGTNTRPTPQPTNKDSLKLKPASQPPVTQLKHSLPPKPQSPPRRNGKVEQSHNIFGPQKSLKRPHEESTPQNRTKLENVRPESASKLGSTQIKKNDTPKAAASEQKPKALTPATKRPFDAAEATKSAEKRQKVSLKLSSSQPSPSVKTPSSSQTPTSKSHPTTSKPQTSLKIKSQVPTSNESRPSSQKSFEPPRLLSPLPADLEDSFEPLQSLRPSQNTPSRKTPSKSPAADTIVVKEGAKAESLETPDGSDDDWPPFNLPPMLSPGLPAIVEKELDRLHEKGVGKKHVPLSQVYEERRQTGAKGVAIKKPKERKGPNIGHPPKKEKVRKVSSDEEASKGRSDFESDKAESSKKASIVRDDSRLIVKMKYKKRMAQSIERILKLKPRPDPKTAEWMKAQKKNASRKDDDSEEDVPLSRVTKPAAPPPSKKRPGEHFDTEAPAPKRSKPANVDVAKSKAPVEPPFKSPAVSTPAKKDLLSTPKKDIPKSTAMRKVPSTDSHALTPQATASSTPASAEKPRINGDHIPRSNPDLPDTNKYLGDNGKGRILKREMDNCLKSKQNQFHLATPQEVKRGLCKGIECLDAYNTGFCISTSLSSRRKAENFESSLGLWSFVRSKATDRRSSPVLACLTWQMGAMFGEELERAYDDVIGSMFKERRDPKEIMQVWAKKEKNTEQKETCWRMVNETRASLEDVGVGRDEIVQPWMRWGDASEYFIRVLGAFEREEKVGWKQLVI